MDRNELEALDRESLVSLAERAGVRRARILTRPELVDELLRAEGSASDAELRRARGFFGRARDLLARVVERGLHLPDAADRIRSMALGPLPPSVPRVEPQAVPTVTLAEIYAAQGHKERAIDTLRRVLEREPDHAAARALLARLEDAAYVAPPPPLPPEPEVFEAEAASPADEEEDVASEPEPVTASEPREAREPPPGVEADECVAVPLGAGAMYVWWSVAEPSLRAAREGGDAPFVVRIVIVTPSVDGPRRETRDVTAEPSAGGLALRGLPDDVVLRVAVGVGEGDAFVPIAHSPALEAPRRGAGLVRWTLRGVAPVSLDDPRSRSIARALSAASALRRD